MFFHVVQPDPDNPICGLDGFISGYLISVTGLDPVELSPTEYSYEVDDISEVGSDTYSVSVTARNVLGLGNATEHSFSKLIVCYMYCLDISELPCL